MLLYSGEIGVLPVLLYGVENWILSPESIRMLECFQGEIAKTILNLPKWYSNTTAWLELTPLSLHHQKTKVPRES